MISLFSLDFHHLLFLTSFLSPYYDNRNCLLSHWTRFVGLTCPAVSHSWIRTGAPSTRTWTAKREGRGVSTGWYISCIVSSISLPLGPVLRLTTRLWVRSKRRTAPKTAILTCWHKIGQAKFGYDCALRACQHERSQDSRAGKCTSRPPQFTCANAFDHCLCSPANISADFVNNAAVLCNKIPSTTGKTATYSFRHWNYFSCRVPKRCFTLPAWMQLLYSIVVHAKRKGTSFQLISAQGSYCRCLVKWNTGDNIIGNVGWSFQIFRLGWTQPNNSAQS